MPDEVHAVGAAPGQILAQHRHRDDLACGVVGVCQDDARHAGARFGRALRRSIQLHTEAAVRVNVQREWLDATPYLRACQAPGNAAGARECCAVMQQSIVEAML